MTAATKVERSGLAIRATLTEFSPAECEEFEAEFRQALAHADTDFDLGHVDAVLDRWWGIAAMCANPLTEQEHELVVQARAGVDTGWYVRKNEWLSSVVDVTVLSSAGWRSRSSTTTRPPPRPGSRSTRGSSNSWNRQDSGAAVVNRLCIDDGALDTLAADEAGIRSSLGVSVVADESPTTSAPARPF